MNSVSAAEQRILDDLVSLWQRHRAEGQPMTAADLCHDRPEMLPALERQIAALEQMESLVDDMRLTPTVLPQSSVVQLEVTSAFPGPLSTMETGSPKPAPAPPADLSGAPNVPGYEIMSELGRGGMGVVYKARQTRLGRMVALKMILSGDMAGETELARFRTEGEAIARLQHPNIVQIFEVGEHDGRPFFSLEFCDGGSLSQKLRAGPLLARDAAVLVERLARAMHLAHQAGIVHRDLKPANILLTADGAPKVTDFGLAKMLGTDSGQTQTGAVMGTPRYMAPEQATGKTKEIGPATDVYALGAILYEVLTGRAPFLAPTSFDTIRRVVSDPPLALHVLQPKVPRDLETICLKCLEKDARKRYGSAEDLGDDLQRWLDGQPIQARPVPQWERAWKWARRRPALAGLTAAMLVALLAGAASAVLYGLYASQKADARERDAQAFERDAQTNREIQDHYDKGQQAEAGSQFDQAKDHFVQALAMLRSAPGAPAADMRHKLLQESINRVGEPLKEQERLAKRQALTDQMGKFRNHYDKVRFRAVRFRNQDADDDAAIVRKEAAAALKELGFEDVRNPQFLEQRLESLRQLVENAEQRQQLAEECVEVLLAWADAEAAAPQPGGPSEALRLLDGAATLSRAFGLASVRALHLRRAKFLQALGDAPGARAEEQRAADITPTLALDHFEEALTSYRADRVTDASLIACTRVLRLRPDHFWAQYLQALCYLRRQRWGEAEFALNVCLGQNSKFAWLFPYLGLAHTELKQYAAAEEDFDKALAGSSDPVLRTLVHINRSVLRQRQGRPDDAERDLRMAIDLQPKIYQSYLSLANLLKRKNDRAGALKLIDQALAINAEEPTLYFERARLRAENGDRAAAQRDFEQVIAKEKIGSESDQVLRARIELAHLRCLAGEYKAALADCDVVLAAKRDFPEAHRQRAEALLGLGGKPKEAIAALEQYLKTGGKETPAVHKARGILYAQQNEYRSAVAAYSQALALAPDPKTLSLRGWAYLKQEAVSPALDDFDAALKSNPKDADALTGRGMALAMRGKAADIAPATAAVDRALQAEPRTFPRLLTCARIYSRAAEKARNPRLGNDPQATRYAQRALQLLREAQEMLPEKEREKFWRDHVWSDPGLLQLVRSYSRQ